MMTRFGRSSLVAVLRGLSVALTAAMLFFVMEGHAQAQSVMTRHVRPEVTSGQAKFLNRLPATQTLRVDIVLPLRDQAGLENFLQEVYDPTSPSYRHFLTVAEFTERFGPTQEDYDAVVHYAESNGFEVLGPSRNRMNVNVTASVASIEAAFNVSMGVYQHPTENRSFYAPDREPTVYLPFPVWHISGLDNYSIPRPLYKHRNLPVTPNATTGSGPSTSYLGSDMRAAYYGSGPLTGTGQSLGLLEYYGTDLADLTTYFKNAVQTNNVPITLLSTDGSSTSCVYPKCDDTEQTLDMTQALGMAPGLSSLVMYVGSTDSAIFNAMATASPLNAQLSCSWYWSPVDPGTDNPYFEEFAAQGQNLFDAAGDDEDWQISGSIWPADNAYLTSVGGTSLTTSSAGGLWSSETTWEYGGGGISPNKIPIPSWQTATASGCSNCSKSYRNGPDVSANADFTFYVCADQTACTANYYGGTSFAAPMWAGYLALANQQFSQGCTPSASVLCTLGFINPAIYTIGLGSSYDTDFHDITNGSNGYSATTGYDLATGWGSPNGSGLITALAGPSSPNFSISASPTSVSVAQGSSGTSTITTAISGGFSSAISLSASGQPTGVTAGFGTNPIGVPGSGTSILTLTVVSGTTPGTYPITVSGMAGSTTNTTTVTLTVPTPNFTISASPTSVSVQQGNSGTSTITTAALNGFNSAVTLSASGVPSNVTPVFGTNPIPAPGSGTSLLTLTVASGATPGTYPITITGMAGSTTNTTTVTLKVTGPLGISISSVSPSSVTLVQGSSAQSLTVSLTRSSYTGSITLSTSTLPSGVTATFTQPGTRNSGSISLKASSTASLVNNLSITITASGAAGSGVSSVTSSFTLTVNPAPSIAISSVSPSSVKLVRAGSAQSLTVNLTRTNYTGSITLSTSSLPSHVTATFTQPGTGNSGSISLSAASNATLVTNRSITITAKGSGVSSATATFSLTVSAH